MKKNRTTPVRRAGKEKQANSVGKRLVWGLLASLTFTALCILVIAFMIKTFDLPDSAIHPINVAIKLIAAMIAAFVMTRPLPSYTWAWGALAGALYMLTGYALISLLDGGFGPLPLLFGDVIMGIIVGFASGIIAKMIPAKKAKLLKR